MTIAAIEQTAVETPEKLYENQCLDVDAPRHVHLEIEVGQTSAGIHCKSEVHVGPGMDRAVTFRANESCILKFDNEAVFGTSEKALDANKLEALPIGNEVDKAQTQCAILPDKTWNLRIPQQSPPRIVVP